MDFLTIVHYPKEATRCRIRPSTSIGILTFSGSSIRVVLNATV